MKQKTNDPIRFNTALVRRVAHVFDVDLETAASTPAGRARLARVLGTEWGEIAAVLAAEQKKASSRKQNRLRTVVSATNNLTGGMQVRAHRCI